MTPKSLSKWQAMPFITFSFSEKNLIPTPTLSEDFSSTKSSFERTRWKRHIYSLLNAIQHWAFDALEYRTISKVPTLLTSIHY